MADTAHLSGASSPWRAEIAATLRLSWPLALANLLQMLTYAIDVIFIARLGEQQLAASALVVSVFGLIVWALSGLTGAVSAVISAALGARAPALRPVRRATRMALWLAVLSGAAGMALMLGFEQFALLTGQDPVLAALGQSYALVLLCSTIPFLINNVLRSFVSALDRPIFATAITALGIGVNAVGNYAFIFGNWGAPELGLPGAAVATLMTSLFTMGAYVIAIRIDPKLHRYHIFGRWWVPDWQAFGRIVRIGTPIALMICAEAGVFGAAAFLMGNIGAAQLAAHTIALQIAALAFQVPFGVGQATTIRVGYFYGARDSAGMARAGWAGIAIALVFMSCTASAMVLIPRPLLAIYIDPWDIANAGLVAFATRYLLVAAAFQLVDGVQAVAAGALRGLQDTRVPMWIAVFSYWVPGFGLSLALGFATHLAGVGVWIGLATGLAFAAALLTWRWARREALGLTRFTPQEAAISPAPL
ncbi:MATE family efflux transporter [Citromicrobium bathyomarinum]|uniref:MATE family efflux transporter n=1 Tax=Sphingomonadales TaxID=204457 RepID=UPI000C45BA4C|nr:MATE family efflux transporter [Citromicrobium sp.]MBO81255.1 MATE family efflux transporter [Citromicrobium sp.]|tara:strand:- start:1546 stop:2973 length:1428 start_codon:yes stop_codon:yes gene_type:complete